MKRFVRVDLATFFLILFVVLMSFVFYYFLKISSDVQNYNKIHHSIISMQLLDKGVDDFTSSVNQLHNYNVVNKILEEFNVLLKKIETDTVLYYPQDKKLQNYLKDMSISFKSKGESVEYFKSLNASLISGSAFLFDLQRNISDAHDITYKTKNLVDETMFYLFQFHSSRNIQKTFIEKKLEQLHGVFVREDDKMLKNFYKQSKVLLATTTSLDKLSKEIQSNKLAEQLNLLHNTVDKEYDNNLYQEKIIATFLFLLMVVVWIIFIVMYIRSRKDQKILQQHASVFFNTQEVIVITNPQGYVVSINRAFTDIYGYEINEVKGKKLNILHFGMQDELFFKICEVKNLLAISCYFKLYDIIITS